MRRLAWMLVLLATVQACENKVSSEVVHVAQPDEFTGTWRSITASTEFVRLTVESLSSEQGALGARLTFSGVYWDGTGRISGDSLVAQMGMTGRSTPDATLVAYFGDSGVMNMELRRDSTEPLRLSFVRDN
jgi:hypothetical protein